MKKSAIKGAEKICGIGQCHYAYQCGHTNKATHCLPMFEMNAETEECPLAKYNVTPTTKTWLELGYNGTHVSDSEFRALCKECKWKSEDEMFPDGDINTEHFFRHCINCPVYGAYEYQTEVEAEAAANMD